MESLNKKHIFNLIGILLVIRLFITILLSGNIPVADAKDYNTIAQSLLYKGLFADEVGNLYSRPPLYPFYLYGLYKLQGTSFPFVYFIQAIISLIICYLCYLTGKEICNVKAGWLACLLAGINIELIFYPTLLLSETLFLLLFILSLYFLMLSLGANTGLFSRWSILSGLSLGAATLTRPITLGILGFCCLLLYGFSLINKKHLSSANKLTVPFVLMLLIILPWGIRNYRLSGKIVPVAAIDGVNFWIGHHSGANGSYDWPSEVNPLLSDKSDELEMNQKGWTEGFKFIKKYPLEEARISLLKITRLLLPLPDYSFRMSDFLLNNQSIYWAFVVLSAVFWEMLLAIFISIDGKTFYKDNLHLVLSLILIYLSLNHIIFFSTPRYKLPITLILILFAADYISNRTFHSWTGIKWKRIWLLIGIQLISLLILLFAKNADNPQILSFNITIASSSGLL